MADQEQGPRPDAGQPADEGQGPRPDHGQGPRPDYKVYRSRPGLLARLRPGDRVGGLPRPGGGDRERERKGGWSTRRKVVTAVLALLAGWLLVSIALFMVSAQLSKGVSDKADEALSPGGTLLTGSTILVLGSDEREKSVDTESGEGGRADSILLLHVGIGSVRRVSILRDSLAEIPSYGVEKINTAYFIGGPGLMIETVENFMGNDLEINHLIEVSFKNFPELIDSLGGIDVTTKTRICSPFFDSLGAAEFNLDKGENHLDGRQALAFARVRTNTCAPGEDDRARVARQQQVLTGIRDQVVSPSTFVRLPWVSWQAPRAIRSDLKGPGLAALFLDLLTGGTGETRVLQPDPTSLTAGSGLVVPDEEKARAVNELLGE